VESESSAKEDAGEEKGGNSRGALRPPAVPQLDLTLTAKQHNEFAKMFALLEGEARTRRQEITELRGQNHQLKTELHGERQSVITLRNQLRIEQSGPMSPKSPGTPLLAAAAVAEAKMRHLLDAEVDELRAENARLRQKLESALTAQDKRLEADVKQLLDGEVGKLRLEAERFQKALEEEQALSTSHFNNWSTEENARKETEGELARLTKLLDAFLTDCHTVLSGCRSACVQLEAEAWQEASKQPPPMFDLTSENLPGSLKMTLDILHYVAGFLAKASASDTRWLKKFRNMMC
jgi:uncharacterized protein YdcH (DUF465 family)